MNNPSIYYYNILCTYASSSVETPVLEPKTKSTPKKQPPYAVILHNDNYNTLEFVTHVIQQVFGYELDKAFHLVLEAHQAGRCILWSGSFEQAEFKAQQIIEFGPDPYKPDAPPLTVTIEPLPSD